MSGPRVLTSAPGPTGTLHGEDDPLRTAEQSPNSYARSGEALRSLERATLGAGGIVLRYGYFYGPGSSISREGSMAAAARFEAPVP